jgi:hypothetical protein
MSQYPPPGQPQYPPRGQSGYPPSNASGYPPNVPPPGPPGFGPPGYGPPGFGPPGYSMPSTSRTSAAAVTSLVCGLIFCIPGLTGLIAVITGGVGIAATSNPAVKGRGMAIAGLILGLLSLAGWGVLGLVGVHVYQKSGPQRAFAQQYVTDLAAGKIDQCVSNSTANVAQQQLQNDYTQSQAWGTLITAIPIPNSFFDLNGKLTVRMQGAANFSNGSHQFIIVVVTDSSGTKVDSFQWLQ